MKIKALPFAAKQQGISRYMQLYEAIRQEIWMGHMKQGDQLPSIRSASKQLGLSRTTIENAYQCLCMEGLVVSRSQCGYFVDADEKQIHLRREIMEAAPKQAISQTDMDLRSSLIDASAFDVSVWLHYLKDVLQKEQWIMSYGDSQGELYLRKAFQKYIYAMRGVLCKEEQIVVGANFQSLLYLICSLYQGKKIVGMEEGGFAQAEQVFTDCGFQVVYLEHDQEGVRIESLSEQSPGILYINSASCGTLKKAMHSKRRTELLTYAKQHRLLILEDDHNGELRYQTKLRPAMQGFDMGNNVVYMRSFSKLLLPSVRMSFVVLNESLGSCYQKRKHNYHPGASKIEQLAFAQYLSDGHMEKQIRRLRKRYEEKSSALLRIWKEQCPDADILLDESALQVIWKVKHHSPQCYIASAKRAHILIQQHSASAIAISFAAHTSEVLTETMRQLFAVWKKDHLLP